MSADHSPQATTSAFLWKISLRGITPWRRMESRCAFAERCMTPTALTAHVQAVSKWSTRFDLGLSVSVPALFFERSNMYYIADEGRPPSLFLKLSQAVY